MNIETISEDLQWILFGREVFCGKNWRYRYMMMINRGEVIEKIQKISTDHALKILSENPVVGRSIDNVILEERRQLNVGLDRRH